MQEVGLQFGMRTCRFGCQAEEIDCLNGLAKALQTTLTTALEVVAKFPGTLFGERPEQEQFVKVL